jgi:hypothetical protein
VQFVNSGYPGEYPGLLRLLLHFKQIRFSRVIFISFACAGQAHAVILTYQILDLRFMDTSQHRPSGKLKNWLKKLGLIGFLFFLLKGMAWLLITYLIVR